MWLTVGFAALMVVAVTKATLVPVTCERTYKKIGCFRQGSGNIKAMLINDRDVTSSAHTGHILDWTNYRASIHSLACRCSEAAKKAGYTYFAIAFWAECYGGKDEAAVNDLLASRKQINECKGPEFKDCIDGDDNECVGKANADYVYRVVDKTLDIDGGYGQWSEFSACSVTCGGGIKARERSCNNPVPKGAGKDCASLGDDVEEAKCNTNPCPVDGGLSQWSTFGDCSATCGDGTRTRQRSCTNPAPVGGGKPCRGETIETTACRIKDCPVHGRFTEWGTFTTCSQTCGGGSQTRSRKCIDPLFGGNPCMGATTESKACGTEPCPIDGQFGPWSAFGGCSVSCGGGVREANRKCDSPAPQFGGKACVGPYSKLETCNQQSCRVDGQWTQWTLFGACDKDCGCGRMVRTRTCTNPAPQNGGAPCPGFGEDSKECHQAVCKGISGVYEIQEFVYTAMLNYYTKTFPTTKMSGKFFQAIFEIQSAASTAMISDKMTPSGSNLKEKLEKLKLMLKTAVDGGSSVYARRVLGVIFHVYVQLRVTESKPVCGVDPDANKFVDILITFVGQIEFTKVISQKGDVTLMFTIDTTGSMADEISAAKSISLNIINDARDYDVDYILSPFNDPGTGPVIYQPNTQRQQFSNAIGALKAAGGGDCPELAMTGILNALNHGPKFGSPMFVFTDASARDATPAKIQEVKLAADSAGATLNFFMNPAGCSGAGAEVFRNLASHTGGQFFALTSSSELVGFSKFVASSLETDTMLSSGATVTITTGKRSLDRNRNEIHVDRTIKKLIVAVSVQVANTANLIILSSPGGATVAPSTTTSLNRVYTVDNPAGGMYRLQIPVSCGRYEYSARGISADAITFGVGFMYEHDGNTYVLDSPISGRNTKLAVQMAGIAKVDLSQPFVLRVLDAAGNSLQDNIRLTQSTVGDDIVIGSITPPAVTFRLVMQGTTRAGERFERESKSAITARSTFLVPVEAGDGFSAKAGVHFGHTVKVNIYNTGRRQYTLDAKVDLGTIVGASKSLWINEKYVLTFEFFPRNGFIVDKGKTAIIQVSAVSGDERVSVIIPVLLT